MNTNNKLKEAIKEHVLALAPEAQEVVNSFNWLDISEQIARKHNLTDREISDFQTETALVLVGLTDPELYEQNIENEAGTTKKEAEKLAQEAIDKIFTPMGEKITEHIKKKALETNTSWDQNVNFALSGGNYSAFLEKKNPTEPVATNIIKNDGLLKKLSI